MITNDVASTAIGAMMTIDDQLESLLGEVIRCCDETAAGDTDVYFNWGDRTEIGNAAGGEAPPAWGGAAATMAVNFAETSISNAAQSLTAAAMASIKVGKMVAGKIS